MNKESLIKKIEELGDKNPDEVLILRGKLINLIKEEIKKTDNQTQKSLLRIELISELKKHKKHIEMMKNNSKEFNYSLPKQVGLKVKEISTVINLFKEKYDVIEKCKRALTNTAVSGVFVVGISAALTAIAGGGITLASLAALIPTLSYIGLSNILRESVTESGFTKMINTFENKDEIFAAAKEFADKNIVNNEKFINLLLRKKDAKDNHELEVVNKLLIKEYEEIISKAPTDIIRHALIGEKIGVMKELKDIYKSNEKDFIKDKQQMTTIEFAQLEKKILQLDIDIYKEENLIEDALKNAASKIKVNTATMYLARIVLSSVFPSLSFETVADCLEPFFYIVLNNITNLGEFKKHIKLDETKYTEMQIRINKPELFKKLSENKELVMA